jgi:hypothetical protein
LNVNHCVAGRIRQYALALVVALAAAVTGCGDEQSAPESMAANVDETRMASAAFESENWMSHGR